MELSAGWKNSGRGCGSTEFGSRLILRPGKPGLQEKKWPIESFFHKVGMLRNRLGDGGSGRTGGAGCGSAHLQSFSPSR